MLDNLNLKLNGFHSSKNFSFSTYKQVATELAVKCVCWELGLRGDTSEVVEIKESGIGVLAIRVNEPERVTIVGFDLQVLEFVSITQMSPLDVADVIDWAALYV